MSRVMFALAAVIFLSVLYWVGQTYLAGECRDTEACAERNDEPVPDVKGMALREACSVLQRSSYLGIVSTVPASEADTIVLRRVVSQKPAAGKTGGYDDRVELTPSSPLAERDVSGECASADEIRDG